MRKEPTRPSPVAYIGLGVLITIGLSPLSIRVVAYGVPLGHRVNLALFVASCFLLTAAGGYGAALIVRYFRATRVEDRIEREVEVARMQAEVDSQRAEVDKLHQRMEEIENQNWWGDAAQDPSGDDTVDLSNVRFLPVRKPPESRSS